MALLPATGVNVPADTLAGARFKWSRENGSVVAAIEQFDGTGIFVDDLGWGDVACFGGKVPTPSIDRMAKDGARVDAIAAQIWTNAVTLERVGAYVAKTLKKG